jgi:hypothetical protein
MKRVAGRTINRVTGRITKEGKITLPRFGTCTVGTFMGIVHSLRGARCSQFDRIA